MRKALETLAKVGLLLIAGAAVYIYLNPSRTSLYCRQELEFYRGWEVRVRLQEPATLLRLSNRPHRLGLVLKAPLTLDEFKAAFEPFGAAIYQIFYILGSNSTGRLETSPATTAAEIAATLHANRDSHVHLWILEELKKYGLPGLSREEATRRIAEKPEFKGIVKILLIEKMQEEYREGALKDMLPTVYAVELEANPREVYRRLTPRLLGMAKLSCLVGTKPFLPERLPPAVQALSQEPYDAFTKIENDPEALVKTLEDLVKDLYGVELFPEGRD